MFPFEFDLKKSRWQEYPLIVIVFSVFTKHVLFNVHVCLYSLHVHVRMYTSAPWF